MTSASVPIVASVIAAITVSASALMAYSREKFNQERILKADDLQLEKERMMLNNCGGQNQLLSLFGSNNQMGQPMYQPQQQPMIIPMTMNQNGVAQMDVNWVDSYNIPPPIQQRQPVYQQRQMYCDNPIYRNTTTVNPNMEFTFGDNDEMIRNIASRPPTASPIFGYKSL